MNQFRKLAEHFSGIDKVEGSIRSYLKDEATPVIKTSRVGIKEGSTLGEIVALFDTCYDLLLHSVVPDEIKETHLSFIRETKAKFLSALLTPDDKGFLTRIDCSRLALKLELLGDLAASAKAPLSQELDRKAIAESTSELINTVSESALPEYAKVSLQIKLKAIVVMANEAAIYPDEQVRVRIKAIVADSEVEFREFDKEFRTLKEQINSWAKVVLKGGLFGLALTADASAVVALIEGPK